MASIVEREYRLAEEAPLMAGVFWNRLRIGMALQSCATVVYAITENLGRPHPSRLFDRDLKINDPFNTYMFPGLAASTDLQSRPDSNHGSIQAGVNKVPVFQACG
jgi:UPF0755 protein